MWRKEMGEAQGLGEAGLSWWERGLRIDLSTELQ